MVLAHSVMAQSPAQWGRLARESAGEGDFFASTFYFKKAAQADSLNLGVWLEYADALRITNDYSGAEAIYKYVFEHPMHTSDLDIALYWQAKMQQHLGMYQDAEVNFKSYANYYAESSSFYKKDALQQRKSCDWALLHLKDTLDLEIRNIGVNSNSNYADFGGSMLNDSTLIFSSLRYVKKDSSMELHKSEFGNRLKVLKAIRRDSTWVSIDVLDSLFINQNVHIANAHFFPDSNWVVYSQCPSYGNCKIYYSKWNGDYFEESEEFPDNINLQGFNTTQPFLAIVDNALTLFYSTNRPQGKGGMDIWYSIYSERHKTFGFPKNMGRNVNTKGNEITPFWNADSNLLFFSSDWHEGFGGFDIFESKANSLRSMRKPANMGLGINSSVNDLYFAEFPEDSIALFSSNREGGMKLEGQTCCNDIYAYKIEAPIVPIVDTIVPDTTPKVPVIVEIEELNNYLPVLYFDNDQPNPRSLARTTTKSYYDCFHEYLDRRGTYLSEYTHKKSGSEKDTAHSRITHFFTEKVEKGMDDFDLFCELLLHQLEKGDSAIITIKGYSSRLAGTKYNLHLTERRIESLINYMDHYKDGILKPYLPHSNNPVAAISFEKIPFGESQASHITSDDLNDKVNSVYSPDAMQERRIEILHVSKKETLPIEKND